MDISLKRWKETRMQRLLFFMMLICFASHTAWAEFVPGTTYDKSNAHEISDMLSDSIMLWLTEDEYVMKTGEIEDWGHSKAFVTLTRQNEGKFDINGNGNLTTMDGKPVDYIMGMPFPTIDPADPKAGDKIIQNMFASRYYYQGAAGTCGTMYWLSRTGGPERQVISGNINLYYWNRRQGEIPNPNEFLSQRLNYVIEPMELKGTTQMAWSYIDDREDSAFAYVPAIRRVRRVSAASRSDPFLGSDGTVDDSSGFDGKPSSMKWKLLGIKKLLVPVTTLDTITYPVKADGSYSRIVPPIKIGFMDKDWKGPSYSPISWYWIPREVYIVEAIPKDPYYNASKIVMYIDKELGYIMYKDVYDRAGEFWKVAANLIKKIVLSTGEPSLSMSDMDFYLDWRAKHALAVITENAGVLEGAITQDGNLPPSIIGPKFFTESSLKQITK